MRHGHATIIVGGRAHFLLRVQGGRLVTDFGAAANVTEETLATRRKDLVAWLRASRKGWDENNADTTLWPPKWETTWFAGTGRTIANEIFFNTAQLPLIEAAGGVFSMTEEGIAGNIEALSKVGIKATREMFDTTLLEEI